jgi:hypothetical protein
MKHGPHGGGHGHPDKNSFVLYAGGGVLARDPGTTAYGVPLQSEWFRTSVAHNTLVVDEASQAAATGRSLAFRDEPRWQGAIADAGPALGGLRFRRCAALLDGHVALFVDHISPLGDVATSSAHALDLAYHPDGAWADVPAGEPITLSDKPGYKHIRDAKVVTLAPAPRSGTAPVLELGTQRAGSRGTWWTTILAGDAPTRAIVGTGVGRNTEDRTPVLLMRRNAVATTYVWAVGLKPGVRPQLTMEPLTAQPGTATSAHLACAVRVAFVPVGSTTQRSWRVVSNPDGMAVALGSRQITEPLTAEPGDG